MKTVNTLLRHDSLVLIQTIQNGQIQTLAIAQAIDQSALWWKLEYKGSFWFYTTWQSHCTCPQFLKGRQSDFARGQTKRSAPTQTWTNERMQLNFSEFWHLGRHPTHLEQHREGKASSTTPHRQSQQTRRRPCANPVHWGIPGVTED